MTSTTTMLGWARSGLPRTKRADRRLDGVGFGLPVMHAGLLGAGVKRPSVPQDARRCCPTPCPDCCPFFLGPGAASAVRSEKHGCATPRKRARATPWATLRAPPTGNGLALLRAVILATFRGKTLDKVLDNTEGDVRRVGTNPAGSRGHGIDPVDFPLRRRTAFVASRPAADQTVAVTVARAGLLLTHSRGVAATPPAPPPSQIRWRT